MKKKGLFRALSTVLCCAVSASAMATLASCNSKKKKDSIVLMTEELSGLFNPFYATAGTDMDVVGMTQIGMLSTDKNGQPEAGDHVPTVVKDFEIKTVGSGDTAKTVYTFVLKNDLKFSDGHPLTMQDVLFNMYEYLDPVYTGSSTMYSIDIEGLQQYRTQMNLSAGGSSVSEQISNNAASFARIRILELIDIYETNGRIGNSDSQSFSLDEEGMKEAIGKHNVSSTYKSAVATNQEQAEVAAKGYDAEAEYYRNILLKDYELTLKTFKEELQSDFRAAKESYDLETAPYNKFKKELSNDIFKFFLYEGYIIPKYKEVEGKEDKTVIEKFENTDIVNKYKSEEAAIERVFGDNVTTGFNKILSYWGTAGTLATLYAAESIDIQLHNSIQGDSLLYPNISGIVSVGHKTNETSVTITKKSETGEVVSENTYAVAQEHNLDADGKPINPNEYEVLRITVNGTDPKAIYNFGFTVAPSHYYSADSDYPEGRPIDIANNKFGVEYADSDFQSYTIQSAEHVKLPMGAGAFKATNSSNSDNPKASEFWSSNIVYFKANDNFEFEVKAKKLRMQVVSASNALDMLENGEIDYITPQFTQANSRRLKSMESDGFTQLSSWQLGYGYIGINAGKVPNINIRRAIMSAMQTGLACEFYEAGTCKPISWPMSSVSWAYPKEADGTTRPNGRDYTNWTTPNAARQKILKYMNAAGVQEGDSKLKIKFTIAGASITEHPTYAVFKQAADILNSMGWDVEVKADSQALLKLSTGSLEVWAAAWGSTIDPDMYQVYHKNSSATSVYAWGYREIKASPSTYPEEYRIINELSKLIDDGRAAMDQAVRKPIYENAMKLVLDLAVELPVYQRKTLYAYNSDTIKGLAKEVNEYSSPLEKLWELELV